MLSTSLKALARTRRFRLDRATGRRGHQVTVEGTEVVLEGLQVVARHVDRKLGTELVRRPKSPSVERSWKPSFARKRPSSPITLSTIRDSERAGASVTRTSSP